MAHNASVHRMRLDVAELESLVRGFEARLRGRAAPMPDATLAELRPWLDEFSAGRSRDRAAPVTDRSDRTNRFLGLLGESLGGMAAETVDLSDEEISQLLGGFAWAASGRPWPGDLNASASAIQRAVEAKQAERKAKVARANLTAAGEYFTKLKQNPAVEERPSGLRYEITQPGSGASPQPGQVARLHYTGTLLTGEVFDSSVQRGEPVELVLEQTIAGFAEGVRLMKIGGKSRLHIPPHLAYGDEGSPGAIPPAATIVFEVELLELKDAPTNPPAAAN